MAIYDKIVDEKLQYNITREAAKIALSSGKIDKYNFYRWRNVFFCPKSNDRTNQVYTSSFGKSFQKTSKNNWRSRKKQVEASKVLKSDVQQQWIIEVRS